MDCRQSAFIQVKPQDPHFLVRPISDLCEWARLPSLAPTSFPRRWYFFGFSDFILHTLEVIHTLSPSPFWRWLKFCGAFWGPSHLGKGVLRPPPAVSLMPGETIFWVAFESLIYFASTFFGFFGPWWYIIHLSAEQNDKGIFLPETFFLVLFCRQVPPSSPSAV